MNPRQARRERREAERKAKKLELKKTRLSGAITPTVTTPELDDPRIQPRWNPDLEDEFPREEQIRQNAITDRISLQAGLPIPPPGPSPSFNDLLAKRNTKEIGFVSQRRTQANRANAQHSTGPTSPTGKLASSRNSTKHGLASGTLLLPGEDPAAFESLLHDLLAEHQPANPTEDLLIQEMAQSYWLSQRALRLQNTCFTDEGINEKQLALFLRYGTTYERRFYKALHTLRQLKQETAQLTRGFVSQTSPHPPKLLSTTPDRAATGRESEPVLPPPTTLGQSNLRI